jgi:hypothetical protein
LEESVPRFVAARRCHDGLSHFEAPERIRVKGSNAGVGDRPLARKEVMRELVAICIQEAYRGIDSTTNISHYRPDGPAIWFTAHAPYNRRTPSLVAASASSLR